MPTQAPSATNPYPPLFRATVDVAAIGDVGGEPYAIRGAAESFGADARLLSVGCAAHVVDVLSGRASRADYLVLSCHGDESGLLLPGPLAAEVVAAQPFAGDVLTPELARRYVRLPGRTVVTTGCETGTDAMAEAFLAGSASAYLAPAGAPDGDAAVMYVLTLLYGLIGRRLPLPVAHALALGLGPEMTSFQLYES